MEYNIHHQFEYQLYQFFLLLGTPLKKLNWLSEELVKVKSKFGVWTILLIRINGLLLISTPWLTLLYSEVTTPRFSVTLKLVPAIPVNSKEISSRTKFLSSGSNGSNFLENNLPLKVDPVSKPTGPLFPYGASTK